MIGTLVYELDLPVLMRIYLVISISILKPALINKDPYRRTVPKLGLIKYGLGNGEVQYQVERILNRRITRPRRVKKLRI